MACSMLEPIGVGIGLPLSRRRASRASLASRPTPSVAERVKESANPPGPGSGPGPVRARRITVKRLFSMRNFGARVPLLLGNPEEGPPARATGGTSAMAFDGQVAGREGRAHQAPLPAYHYSPAPAYAPAPPPAHPGYYPGQYGGNTEQPFDTYPAASTQSFYDGAYRSSQLSAAYPAEATHYPAPTYPAPTYPAAAPAYSYPSAPLAYPYAATEYPYAPAAPAYSYPAVSHPYRAAAAPYPSAATSYPSPATIYPSAVPTYPSAVPTYPSAAPTYPSTVPTYPSAATNYSSAAPNYPSAAPNYSSAASAQPTAMTHPAKEYPPGPSPGSSGTYPFGCPAEEAPAPAPAQASELPQRSTSPVQEVQYGPLDNVLYLEDLDSSGASSPWGSVSPRDPLALTPSAQTRPSPSTMESAFLNVSHLRPSQTPPPGGVSARVCDFGVVPVLSPSTATGFCHRRSVALASPISSPTRRSSPSAGWSDVGAPGAEPGAGEPELSESSLDLETPLAERIAARFPHYYSGRTVGSPEDLAAVAGTSSGSESAPELVTRRFYELLHVRLADNSSQNVSPFPPK